MIKEDVVADKSKSRWRPNVVSKIITSRVASSSKASLASSTMDPLKARPIKRFVKQMGKIGGKGYTEPSQISFANWDPSTIPTPAERRKDELNKLKLLPDASSVSHDEISYARYEMEPTADATPTSSLRPSKYGNGTSSDPNQVQRDLVAHSSDDNWWYKPASNISDDPDSVVESPVNVINESKPGVKEGIVRSLLGACRDEENTFVCGPVTYVSIPAVPADYDDSIVVTFDEDDMVSLSFEFDEDDVKGATKEDDVVDHKDMKLWKTWSLDEMADTASGGNNYESRDEMNEFSEAREVQLVKRSEYGERPRLRDDVKQTSPLYKHTHVGEVESMDAGDTYCGSTKHSRSGMDDSSRHSVVSFQFPPVQSLMHIPRTDTIDLPDLFFSEHELEQLEEDRNDTYMGECIETVAKFTRPKSSSRKRRPRIAKVLLYLQSQSDQ